MAEGRIIIQPGANVWPHEMRTAQALVQAGYTVEFIRRSEEKYATSADCVMEGHVWEMKSPTSNSLRRVQKALRSALKQSDSVIFDSRRMKGLPDPSIERELRRWAQELRLLKHLIMIGRKGTILVLK